MRVKITTKHIGVKTLYLQSDLMSEDYDVIRSNSMVANFSGSIYTGTINRLELGSGDVTNDNIANGAVSTLKLADESVTTAKLASSAVTLDKLDPSIRSRLAEEDVEGIYVVAKIDSEGDYHVASRIYAKDLVVENSDGSYSSLEETFIDDSTTSSISTWSSTLISSKFNNKSDISHSHTEYSLSQHTHTTSQIIGMPTSLPADGGDADTLGGYSHSSFAKLVGADFTGVLSVNSSEVYHAGNFNNNTTDVTAGNIVLSYESGANIGWQYSSANLNPEYMKIEKVNGVGYVELLFSSTYSSTTANRAFRFKTNVDENAIYVNCGGLVGIGTSSPTEKLTVNGKIVAQDVIATG